MSDEINSSVLANYRLFVTRLDELCGKITNTLSSAISCRPGCSSCCCHLTVFPVEAAAVTAAVAIKLHALPSKEVRLLKERTALAKTESCPFLIESLCLLYEDRPIICRTHGLPLLVRADGEKRLDFCPENFREIASLPGSMVIDIDTLNQTLVAINAKFLKESPDSRFRGKERFTLAEVIKLALSEL